MDRDDSPRTSARRHTSSETCLPQRGARMSRVTTLIALACSFLCLGAARFGASSFGGEVSLDGHTFTLPDGFTIERAAGPPLVDRPITASLDEQGRLYISDSSGTNDKVDIQLAQKPHRILRLEDTNGDGVFDQRTVFAENMMFPEGTLWHQGSLYVAAPPSIWKLTDGDGDGVAEQREEWFQGKTLTGCANDLHGPYLGPDGWIYWCKGAFAEQRYERPGKKPFVTKASHIFRCRPDGSGLEHVMTGGMDNPVDVVHLPGGERVFTTTFLQQPGGGKRDGLIHAVYGGVYGKVHDVIENHQRTGDILPPLAHLGPAAPCGLTRYPSTAFGRDFEDNVFACLFNLHKVTRHVPTPFGATYRTRDEDFVVSSNIDFHPTDVLADADGSLLIVNTGGWYKLCCPTSQLWKPDILGAVYRVRRIGAKSPADPYGKEIAWSNASPDSLAALLADDRPAVRERATQLLATTGASSVPAIRGQLRSKSARTREAAVWALTRIAGDEARLAVREALADEAETVRQAALHSISLWRDSAAAPALLGMLKRGTPHNIRAAAEALGRIGDRSAVPALLAAIEQHGRSGVPAAPSATTPSPARSPTASPVPARPDQANAPASTSERTGQPGSVPTMEDRFLEHGLVFALIEIADPAAIREGLKSTNPWVVRASLIALDQMDGGGLEPSQVAPLLSSTQPLLRDTASWLVGRHADWGGSLAGYLRQRLAGPAIAEADRDELRQQLAQFARGAEIQTLLADVVGSAEASVAARVLALGAMRDSGVKATPDAWFGALSAALASPQSEVVAAAVSAARALPPAKQPVESLMSALTLLAHDASRTPAIRLDAAAALPKGLPAVSEELWQFLSGQLEENNSVALRVSAADAISRAKLTNAQLLALGDVMKNAGPLEADRLLGAFEQSTDEKVGLHLIAALRESRALTSLRVDAVRQRLNKYGGAVPEQAEALYSQMNVDAAKQKARIEQLLGSLEGGDIRRGQAIFHSQKAACGSCHAMGYLGGRVGPDLTRIGGIRNERDLLEAIVYPNASFVRSYEPVNVVTTSGKVLNGILKKDTAEEIVLSINATEEVRVLREEIDELRPSTVSVMPSGLDQQLTPQQLADLIAFLRNAK